MKSMSVSSIVPESTEAVERDQEALKKYQESRKRPRSSTSSPLYDLTLDSPKVKKEKFGEEFSLKSTDNLVQHDPSGLYGLKLEYLRILGIQPPICNWVFVENFRCDKTELRDVLELAGYVVVCSVTYAQHKHAKVMYSHPLEAVQAISMLNKQIFYGQPLSVMMMKYPLDSVILPKSLPNVGPGFGAYGKPLRDIAKHYEKFVNKKPNSLNILLFNDPNEPQDDTEVRAPGSVETIDCEKPQEDIYGRFQISKQFQIQYIEDSKSQSDSKNDVQVDTNNSHNAEVKTTSLPKYSPRSPTRSPSSEVNHTNSSSDEGLIRNYSSSENSKLLSTIASNISRNTNPSGPMIRPSGDPVGSFATNTSNNTLLPNPILGSNSAHVPVGTTFGPNPIAMNVSGFGPNGPVRPNVPMTGPGPIRPNVLMTGPGPIRLNVPMTGPGPIRPNAPMAGPMSDPRIGPKSPVAGPMGPGGSGLRPKTGPTPALLPAPLTNTLQFRNLPPTTTFSILSEKMGQCGQVMSIQLTTPGCATVIFSHPAHAQRCFQRFNNMCVDGCIIQARFV